jgi:hypothetical protein
MKKTLLIAAAALAASVISSEAQVYSQNIVGYANLACPTGGKSYAFTCQFSVGSSNGVNEVFGTGLPTGTKVLTWNGINDFDIALYDNTDPNGDGSGPWFQNDDATVLSPLPKLTPGKAFFLVPPSPVTNTFVGTVAINTGTSNVLSMPIGGKSYFVGGVVPYAGSVTNGNSTGSGLNLNGLPTGSKILTWNGVNDFNIALYDNTDPNGDGSGPWFLNDDATPIAPPSVTVGQGFFVVPPSAYNWTNGLPAN